MGHGPEERNPENVFLGARQCYGADVVKVDPLDDVGRAHAIERSYRLADGIYLLGSLETGLTIHSQQLRAHNLAWALAKLRTEGASKIDSIAIVGAGIAGITLAACLMSTLPILRITLIESRSDICPLQQGADHRWVHPNIYDWPAPTARNPRTEVPVLSWSEGRASDVLHTIIKLFSRYCEAHAKKRLETFLGVNFLRIEQDKHAIQWIGHRAQREGPFFRAEAAYGDRRAFDAIVVAAGFGIERNPAGFPGVSYWRNDHLAQPALDGTKQRRMISGLGDGALIDLFRLTIERFRQDVILDELFPSPAALEQFERKLAGAIRKHDPRLASPGGRAPINLFNIMEELWNPSLERIKDRMSKRLRKDTVVIVHAGGENGERNDVRQLFDNHSSVLNRFLLYLLYKCGAFGIVFDRLAEAVKRAGVAPAEVVSRHGTDRRQNVLDLFAYPDRLAARVDELATSRPQQAGRLWPTGFFPHLDA